MPEGKGYKEGVAGVATGAAITKTHSIMKKRAKNKAAKNLKIKKGLKLSQEVRKSNKGAVIGEHFKNKQLNKKAHFPESNSKDAARKAPMRRAVTASKQAGKGVSTASKSVSKSSVIRKLAAGAFRNITQGVGKALGAIAPKVNPVGLRKKQAQEKGGS